MLPMLPHPARLRCLDPHSRSPLENKEHRMDRRRQSRVFVDLPVQIWGMDAHSRPFTQPASLRSISGRGATLQCVDAQLKPGEVIDILYQGTKAQFRIVWCGKAGTEVAGEVGIESLSADTRLWGIDPRGWGAGGGQ